MSDRHPIDCDCDGCHAELRAIVDATNFYLNGTGRLKPACPVCKGSGRCPCGNCYDGEAAMQRSAAPCPACDSIALLYGDTTIRVTPNDRLTRALEAAYRLGAKDAQRLCVGVARETSEGAAYSATDAATTRIQRMLIDASMVASQICSDIEHIDVTRAMPALGVMPEETHD